MLTPSDCKASVSGIPVSKGYNQHQLGNFLNPSSPSGSGTMVSMGTSRPRVHAIYPKILARNLNLLAHRTFVGQMKNIITTFHRNLVHYSTIDTSDYGQFFSDG